MVDQNDGEYVGWLGNDISVTEDPWVEQGGKDPVVVEISEDGQHLNVHPVRPEDQDLMLRGAGLIRYAALLSAIFHIVAPTTHSKCIYSRGIVFFGEAMSTGFNKASHLYIQHATPNAEPVVLSETTRNNVQRVHAISGQAVTITQKTTGVIHGLIDMMATKIGSTASGSSTPNKATNASRAPGEKGKPDGSTTIEQPQKPKFISRLLMSTNMVVTAVEQSTTTMIQGGGKSVAAGIHHK